MTTRDCPRRTKEFRFGGDRRQIVTVGHVHSPSTSPTAMTPEDYDKLTPEERELKDKENRAREAQEQAGTHDFVCCNDIDSATLSISPPLHMETTTR